MVLRGAPKVNVFLTSPLYDVIVVVCHCRCCLIMLCEDLGEYLLMRHRQLLHLLLVEHLLLIPRLAPHHRRRPQVQST
jgi:hypothetical protein